MKPILYFSAIVLTLSLISCGSEKKSTPEDPQKKSTSRQLDYSGEVSFINEAGDTVSTIEVAIADEQIERNEGLMNIINLPEHAGMLFTFPDETERSFWMSNTPLSLDIIYVNSDSTIVRIHHSTTPYSENQLPSDAPAQYVVETNGGYCIARDIKEGMRITF
ncbi:MAG: DUF192 domain-containing protein [Balneolaceae bacterium]|nr:DUF192 domain-containing protein [Balneolaceae bacterium]